jgi:hypothetical protein
MPFCTGYPLGATTVNDRIMRFLGFAAPLDLTSVVIKARVREHNGVGLPVDNFNSEFRSSALSKSSR